MAVCFVVNDNKRYPWSKVLSYGGTPKSGEGSVVWYKQHLIFCICS